MTNVKVTTTVDITGMPGDTAAALGTLLREIAAIPGGRELSAFRDRFDLATDDWIALAEFGAQLGLGHL